MCHTIKFPYLINIIITTVYKNSLFVSYEKFDYSLNETEGEILFLI